MLHRLVPPFELENMIEQPPNRVLYFQLEFDEVNLLDEVS